MERGPLRLKGSGGSLGAGKREKADPGADHGSRSRSRIPEQITGSKKQQEEKEEEERGLDKRTPAQVAFEKVQEKRQMERILKKAGKTHKQRVEAFNRHLDALAEHCDIPRVSWTK